ncbi:MarR family transcriptional regulator [Rhizobiaceae bacterium BDR2-2]|uniref:MarR family transcriptional regulator n=1 Tax=Ectorhizobium quercum TaxID=2965071 RepID=A0AAE3SUB0_9HYPH|nr:MarR family transcriptional regulator [Ectorhizobium quercum]MCX8997040.1 MarR family transcriptional regulator [Ectorhizobium quercum]
MADEMKMQRNPMADIGLDVLEDTLSFYIRSINMAISRDLDASLDGLEVARGTGKITTLLLVDRHPGIRPSVIATLIQRDRSAMVRLVDQMEESGLLTREVAPDDNRAQGLFITGRGRALAAEIRPRVVRQSREFFPDITDEEHAVLIRVLGRTYRRIVGLPPAGKNKTSGEP